VGIQGAAEGVAGRDEATAVHTPSAMQREQGVACDIDFQDDGIKKSPFARARTSIDHVMCRPVGGFQFSSDQGGRSCPSA
jgi:hypothetical protein